MITFSIVSYFFYGLFVLWNNGSHKILQIWIIMLPLWCFKSWVKDINLYLFHNLVGSKSRPNIKICLKSLKKEYGFIWFLRQNLKKACFVRLTKTLVVKWQNIFKACLRFQISNYYVIVTFLLLINSHEQRSSKQSCFHLFFYVNTKFKYLVAKCFNRLWIFKKFMNMHNMILTCIVSRNSYCGIIPVLRRIMPEFNVAMIRIISRIEVFAVELRNKSKEVSRSSWIMRVCASSSYVR